MQSYEIEYVVSGSLDGTTVSPAFIPLDRQSSAGTIDPEELADDVAQPDEDNIYRFDVDDLGLIDPDFGVGGSLGDRFIVGLWINSGVAAVDPSPVAVVSTREREITLELIESSLVGQTNYYQQDCIFIPQGAYLGLTGWNAGDDPVIVRLHVKAPESPEELAHMLEACCCGVDAGSASDGGGGGGGGSTLTWAQTLLNDNPSGGTDPLITDGDTIRGEPSSTGDGGDIPFITGSTTNVGSNSGAFAVQAGAPGSGGDGGDFYFEGAAGGASLTADGGDGSGFQVLTGAGGDASANTFDGGDGGAVAVFANSGGDSNGTGGTGGEGGDIAFFTGPGGSGDTGGSGGDFVIGTFAGGEEGGEGGNFTMVTGSGADSSTGSAGEGGDVLIQSGDAGDCTDSATIGSEGGDISIISGDGGDSVSANAGSGGDILVQAGDGGDENGVDGAAGGVGGSVLIGSGDGGTGGVDGGDAGDIAIVAGDATQAEGDGGTVLIVCGTEGGGAGVDGDIILRNPDADEVVFSGTDGHLTIPQDLILGTGTASIKSANGIPAYAAPKGSLHLRADGGAGTCLYVNETGLSGGWVAK